MPNILPGVEISITDASNIILQSPNLVRYAAIGEFSKGFQYPTLMDSQNTFQKYYGQYEDITSAYGKKAYISIIQALKQSPVYVSNVYHSDALYAGVGVGSSSLTPFVTGVSSNKTFNFRPSTPVVGFSVGTGNGTILIFDTVLAHTPAAGTMTLHYTKGGVAKTCIDNGLGYFTDNSEVKGTNSTIIGTAVHVEFKTGEAPDNATTITIDYTYNTTLNYLFVMEAISPKSWANGTIGIEITNVNSTYNTFTINEYQAGVLIQSYSVSRDPNGVDGFGNGNYIEDVVRANSYLFTAINNESIVSTTLPLVGSVITYLTGGSDGSAITNTDKTTCVDLFDNDSIAWNIFIGAGEIGDGTSNPVVSEINTLCNKLNKFAYLDVIAGTAAEIVAWATTNVTNNMRAAYYTPNAYVSYNGKTVYCPMSGLVAERYGATVNNGKKYLPAAGTDRGTLNVVSLERYYSKSDRLLLNNVQVNNAYNVPGYGNVIFGDYTAQSKTSSTSFINSVLTLNDMITIFEAYLPSINFKVINDFTILELDTLIRTYLNNLAKQDGTIEPDFKLSIVADKDARTLYANIVIVFQSLVEKIKVNITYTSNDVYVTLG